MNFVFNNKKISESNKRIIEKEISDFIEKNKEMSNFEELKKSFLRNRNYSFSISDSEVVVYTA